MARSSFSASFSGHNNPGTLDCQNPNRRSRLDEFAPGDDIHDGLSETGIAAGTQNRERHALEPTARLTGESTVCVENEGPLGCVRARATERKRGVDGRNLVMNGDGDAGKEDRDAEIDQGPLEHLAGGDERLVRIAVHHGPEDGGADEQKADEARE